MLTRLLNGLKNMPDALKKGIEIAIVAIGAFFVLIFSSLICLCIYLYLIHLIGF